MNATERTAFLQSAALYEEIAVALDERTIEILERRRRSPIVRRRGWLVRRMLLLSDVFGLLLAFAVAQRLLGYGDASTPAADMLLFLATLPAWVVLAKLYGLYDHDEERTDHSTVDELVGVFHLVTAGTWVVVAGGWATGLIDPQLGEIVGFWMLAVPAVTLARASARAYCRRRITYLQNTVIVGAGDVGQLIARKLLQHPEYGTNLVGFVDASPRERRPDLGHLTLLGPPERLRGIVRLFDVERVIVAFSNESHDETLDLIRSLKDLDVQVDIVPRLFELVGPGVGIHTVEGLPLIGLPPLRLSRSSLLLKRILDLTVATAGLVLLAPLLALVALLVKLESRGPVVFRQERMGAEERTFRIFKFRTMAEDAETRKAQVAHLNRHAAEGGDSRMFKVSSDPRTTRVGHFLRRYSLDELPQLLNVLKGEMSLVGPRPLILTEDAHVTAWARDRLRLKPGMTGLWQVLGRTEIPFEEMTKLDYLYVTGWSLGTDLSLILKTIPAVLRPQRAY
jgi:exopolysaccharide biosynthesis polyprenyl glycosylphosphotransferase